MREAFRLNKGDFFPKHLEEGKKQLILMLVYTGKESLPYEKINTSIKKILKRLSSES